MKSPIYAVSLYSKSILYALLNIDSCELPASTGSCSGNETRWYYKSDTCQQFTYSGCGGNRNNFKLFKTVWIHVVRDLKNVNNNCMCNIRL